MQYMTETGETFYYNDKNGEFQWVDPESDPEGASKSESGNWKPYKDPESGAIFWYNAVTNISQWECPSEAIPGGVSHVGGWDASAYEAVQVLHEDDGLYILVPTESAECGSCKSAVCCNRKRRI